MVDSTHPGDRRRLFRRVGPHYDNIRWVGGDDMLVASYAGSGATLLGNILLELDFNYVNPNLEIFLPDGSTVPDKNKIPYRHRLAGPYRRDRSSQEQRAHRSWPRFMKTHLFPEEFADRGFAGVLILVRDPRDALHSWYRYRLQFPEPEWEKVEGSFEDFLRLPDYTGRPPVSDWTIFYRDWSAVAERCAHAAVIRFEDLKRSPAKAMRQTLETIGLRVCDEHLQRAIARSTFEAMRAHEDSVAAVHRDKAQARIMRKGKVEEWRQWMTPELALHFSDDEFRSVARQFRYAL